MDGIRFDEMVKRIAAWRLSRAGAVRGLAGAALVAGGVVLGEEAASKRRTRRGGRRHERSSRRERVSSEGKKKKKPVCLCPTADATGCTDKKAKKKQAKKLVAQACNYAGACQPGMVGTQCPSPPPPPPPPPPACPGTQTLCGQTCVNLQTDATNCGTCGTICEGGALCQGGTCGQLCPGLTPNDDLQTAINAAEVGAILDLCAGTWALTATLTIGADMNLVLRGAGVTQTILDASDAFRVLDIVAGADVGLEDLTVTNGSASDGGGIFNLGTLRLARAAVTSNAASSFGGGIFNDTNATLILQAGARVTGNSANVGAGIYNDDGTVTLQNGSQIAGNTATSVAGGIRNFGMLTLEGGSVIGGSMPEEANSASSGGGIQNVGVVILKSGSHVSGNTATIGGGILNQSAGTTTLEGGSQVTNNSATDAGGIFNQDGGTVVVSVDALVCDNQPLDDQCGGLGAFTGTCPNPASGVCPA